MKNKTNNLKKELKEIITSPKKLISLIWPILLALTLLIPVPYYITLGGGTIKIDKNIKIQNQSKSKGSYNATYVSETKGTIITYLLSYIIPSFEKEKISEVVLNNEEEKDYDFREKMYFESSIDNATFVAYKKANKTINIKTNNLFVVGIDEFSNTDLKVKDKIISIDNKNINSPKDITEILEKYKENDYIEIKVLRDKKQIITRSKINIIDNQKKLGIYLLNDYNYNTNPKLTLDFSDKENGPSAGLMLSLTIYDKLVEEDITKGKKICGTGTIDDNGKVGEIGGVKYKTKGAIRKKCDIFLIPKENYQEAKEIINKKKTKLKLYSVSTFDEALNILKIN